MSIKRIQRIEILLEGKITGNGQEEVDHKKRLITEAMKVLEKNLIKKGLLEQEDLKDG